jgi:hypothetical protein
LGTLVFVTKEISPSNNKSTKQEKMQTSLKEEKEGKKLSRENLKIEGIKGENGKERQKRK